MAHLLQHFDDHHPNQRFILDNEYRVAVAGSACGHHVAFLRPRRRALSNIYYSWF